MPDRRDALKGLAGLTALPALAQQHQHAEPPPLESQGLTAKFFSPTELSSLAEWVELILPRTDTPGARDAHVHYGIDGLCHRVPATGKTWRATLAWLGRQKGSRDEVLSRISAESGTPGAMHFKRLKDTAIEQYYNTREGLQTELGWNANTYVAEFKGCTHPEHR